MLPAAHPHPKRWRVALIVVVALVGLGTFLAVSPAVGRWRRSEIDWQGRRIYRPPHPVHLQDLDLPRVHGELLPRWLIAQGRRARGLDPGAEQQAADALRLAIEPDENLTALYSELRRLSPPASLREDPRRALYLSWAWSDYLDRHNAPFVVQGSIRATSMGPVFAATIYRVHADGVVDVGASPYRVRMGSRIDGTNVREAYLGAAGREDAIIVVDRLREFALVDVWPLLDPALDEALTARRPFARAVRDEALAHLSASSLRVLRQTAAARWAISRALFAIQDRRRTCGSRFRINVVPWSGFPPTRIARLLSIARRYADHGCPGLTEQEVYALDRASRTLRSSPDLAPALDELLAWTAEHVAIHEARHLADSEHADGFDDPLPCPSCTPDMGILARAELSGYLASLAWSPSPALALYQACRTLASDHRARGQPPGPHRAALELIQRRIGPVCLKGPPPELTQLGRTLEREMLERSDPIALDTSFPSRLPVAFGE